MSLAERAPAHAVLFAADDEELVEVVGRRLADGFASGAAVVVIATPEHRRALEEMLRRSGMVPGSEPGYLALDAAQARDRLTSGGRFVPAAFAAFVAEIVGTVGSGRPIAGFGEIVNLLWEAGRVAEAIDLEAAWHGWLADVPVSLTCAYAGTVLDGARPDDIAAVCDQHSSVVAPADAERTWTFQPHPDSATAARWAAAGALLARGVPAARVADLQIVAAELATNAVRHAATPFALTVSTSDELIRVAVADESTAHPVPGSPARHEPSGRGLHLIGALADRWGVDDTPSGKLVWAELDR